jgi:N-hydroxyarylamine O-acetyltransferase
MLLSVEVDGEAWLADVGFGRLAPLYPIRLHQAEAVRQGPRTFRVKAEGGVHVLQLLEADRWFDLYAFSLEPHYPIDYVVANHYTSTHPHSPFVQMLVVQRSSAEARWTLRNRELTEDREGQTTVETLWDDDALLNALADLFDLRFPAGTRFRYLADTTADHE